MADLHAVDEEFEPSSSWYADASRRLHNGVAMQPYLGVYAASISIVSPVLTGWQLCNVYSKPTSFATLARIGVGILPHQTLLKAAQMNAATPIKEHVSPWMAFGVVGVLQGGVYGQCNVTFSKALRLAKTLPTLAGMFRGAWFAGIRDTLSQGVPFMLSGTVQSAVVDPLLKVDGNEDSEYASSARRAVAVAATSIGATYASQGAHNCQIRMQADHSLGYVTAMRTLWAEHGMRLLWMGGSARVALLLLVNGLNEAVLKKAWEQAK